ncbi:uncharacterized protein [Vicugna pacos]|uniref:Basic proline-rich protein-like n=1 Tax=Vicugna pacos TaxID=30538 RepID=A0ABM5CDJ4_VICPA
MKAKVFAGEPNPPSLLWFSAHVGPGPAPALAGSSRPPAAAPEAQVPLQHPGLCKDRPVWPPPAGPPLGPVQPRSPVPDTPLAHVGPGPAPALAGSSRPPAAAPEAQVPLQHPGLCKDRPVWPPPAGPPLGPVQPRSPVPDTPLGKMKAPRRTWPGPGIGRQLPPACGGPGGPGSLAASRPLQGPARVATTSWAPIGPCPASLTCTGYSTCPRRTWPGPGIGRQLPPACGGPGGPGSLAASRPLQGPARVATTSWAPIGPCPASLTCTGYSTCPRRTWPGPGIGRQLPPACGGPGGPGSLAASRPLQGPARVATTSWAPIGPCPASLTCTGYSTCPRRTWPGPGIGRQLPPACGGPGGPGSLAASRPLQGPARVATTSWAPIGPCPASLTCTGYSTCPRRTWPGPGIGRQLPPACGGPGGPGSLAASRPLQGPARVATTSWAPIGPCPASLTCTGYSTCPRRTWPGPGIGRQLPPACGGPGGPGSLAASRPLQGPARVATTSWAPIGPCPASLTCTGYSTCPRRTWPGPGIGRQLPPACGGPGGPGSLAASRPLQGPARVATTSWAPIGPCPASLTCTGYSTCKVFAGEPNPPSLLWFSAHVGPGPAPALAGSSRPPAAAPEAQVPLQHPGLCKDRPVLPPPAGPPLGPVQPRSPVPDTPLAHVGPGPAPALAGSSRPPAAAPEAQVPLQHPGLCKDRPVWPPPAGPPLGPVQPRSPVPDTPLGKMKA